MQLLLGAWTIWSNKAADVATAHVAVGATLFGVGVAIIALALRARSGATISTATTLPLQPASAR